MLGPGVLALGQLALPGQPGGPGLQRAWVVLALGWLPCPGHKPPGPSHLLSGLVSGKSWI